MLGAKTPKRLDDLTHEATGDTGILELVATGTDRHVETLGWSMVNPTVIHTRM